MFFGLPTAFGCSYVSISSSAPLNPAGLAARFAPYARRSSPVPIFASTHGSFRRKPFYFPTDGLSSAKLSPLAAQIWTAVIRVSIRRTLNYLDLEALEPKYLTRDAPFKGGRQRLTGAAGKVVLWCFEVCLMGGESS